eukprot:TRINITY_DN3589_c0_g1_i11.p1 TRINITY_DN3589_c0_g1~~TRINITY_DN3589_c0_g1_i11.p1  ORF type:complete len:188 (-),score=38.31 TRINITY_DN3589_c0_g1_i11:138-701(-)
MGIPNLLQPQEVIHNSDPRSLLLYLSIFKTKFDSMNSSHLQVRRQIHELTKLVLDCTAGFESTSEQFSYDCMKLQDLLSTVDRGEKEKYFMERSTLMDKMVKEALEMMEDLDERNNLLAKENKLLSDQLAIAKANCVEEKSKRIQLENQLYVAHTLQSIGGELDEEGHDVDYYISLFKGEVFGSVAK